MNLNLKLGGGIVIVGNEMDYGFRDCVSLLLLLSFFEMDVLICVLEKE